MTITEPASTDVSEPELCWLNLAALAPHPDNPRTTVGDVTELTRSIRSHGVLQPLLVLPANDDGVYLIAAGRRRYTAASKAGVTEVPAVIRNLTVAEVIEVGLSENGNRTDLTLSEELTAIERLMSLDTGLTPAKLCKRIGRSQAWVKSRMAVTILPPRWRTALDRGDLTLAAGEAAATAADLGPEHLDAVCEKLAGWRHHDANRIVANYRDELQRADAYQRALGKAQEKFAVVYTTDEPAPAKARRVGELFDPDGCKAHRSESCHAVVVKQRTWGDGTEQFEVCTDPKRHAPSKVGTKNGSDLASDRPTSRPGGGGDDSHARRKGRVARLAHTVEVFGKSRGGLSQADLTQIALRGLIHEAGRDELKYAATVLGIDQPGDVTVERLLDGVDTPAALVRVAGAVALGQAENRMYWSPSSPQCRAYLTALTGSGWEPDDWTAAVLDRQGAPDSDDADEGEDADDDAEAEAA